MLLSSPLQSGQKVVSLDELQDIDELCVVEVSAPPPRRGASPPPLPLSMRDMYMYAAEGGGGSAGCPLVHPRRYQALPAWAPARACRARTRTSTARRRRPAKQRSDLVRCSSPQIRCCIGMASWLFGRVLRRPPACQVSRRLLHFTAGRHTCRYMHEHVRLYITIDTHVSPLAWPSCPTCARSSLPAHAHGHPAHVPSAAPN